MRPLLQDTAFTTGDLPLKPNICIAIVRVQVKEGTIFHTWRNNLLICTQRSVSKIHDQCNFLSN